MEEEELVHVQRRPLEQPSLDWTQHLMIRLLGSKVSWALGVGFGQFLSCCLPTVACGNNIKIAQLALNAQLRSTHIKMIMERQLK